MTTTDKLAKSKPDWAGDDLLSRFVNLLIQTKPVYGIMKRQARRVLIDTAERNGIPWRKNYQELEQSAVKDLLDSVTNSEIIYPDYYQVPFHAYDEGNLCWQAAFEAASATKSMALRVWKEEDLTWQEAQQRLRHSFYEILAEYVPARIDRALDLGCSVGMSTLTLQRYFSLKQNTPIDTMGLDLSPYMLAVAQASDTQQEISQWIHGLGESTGLDDNCLDLITLQFVIHELPRQATEAILREALRILKPGGVLGIVDNNPASPVIQKLPPVLFTLMKSTEPWSDDYYTFDVEEAIQQAGFHYQTTTASDPRHRTIIGTKPV
ncbi:MAG: class I SAM-dependent methyltransferase [Cyanobacteria bacterium J06631_2]